MIFPGTQGFSPPSSHHCKGYFQPPAHQSPRTHPCSPSHPTALHALHPISRHLSDPLTFHHCSEPPHSQLRPGIRHLGQSPHHALKPPHGRGYHWGLGNTRPQKGPRWGEAAGSESPDPGTSGLQAKNLNHKSPRVTLTCGRTRQRRDSVHLPFPPSRLFPDLSVPAPPNPSADSSAVRTACNLEPPGVPCAGDEEL